MPETPLAHTSTKVNLTPESSVTEPRLHPQPRKMDVLSPIQVKFSEDSRGRLP